MVNATKVLVVTLHLAAAVLITLAALDQFWATAALSASPPVAYHSPSYVPTHAAWWGVGCTAIGVLLQTRLPGRKG